MKARLALTAALAFSWAATAGIVIEELPGTVTLKQAVRLTDGNVLAASAAPYEVKIHYRGFGNTAEIWFFTGGVFKGKTNAEARGFPSQAPPVSTARKAGEGQKDFVKIDQKVVKLDSEQKAVKFEGVKGESSEKDHTGSVEMSPGFAWGTHGFNPGAQGKVVPSGKSLKLSFDSANSAAGFSALLPAVQK
jgi:hypothetical protein